MQTRVVETFAGHEAQHDPHAQRETEQMWLVESLGIADRLLGGVLAFSIWLACMSEYANVISICTRSGLSVVRVVERLLQHARRLEEAFGVQANDGQAAQRFCPQIPLRQPVDGLLKHRGRAFVVAGVEMVQCRAKPAFGRIAAEADGQVHQFGSGFGGTTRTRRFGRLVERAQCDVVTTCRRQRQMPGAQFGFVDDLGEPTVHRPAPGGHCLGVDTPGQQGMRKLDPVAVDRDNALALGYFEQIHQLIAVADRRPRYQLDGRRRHTRRREQRLVNIGVETAESAPDDIGQCAGQRRHRRSEGPVVQRSGQLDCVKGISARDFVDASHRRP